MSHQAAITPIPWTTAGLVVVWVIGIRKIENDARVRLSTTAVCKLLAEVDGAVETQAPIIVDVDVQCLEVSWSIDNSDFTSLDKVVCFSGQHGASAMSIWPGSYR